MNHVVKYTFFAQAPHLTSLAEWLLCVLSYPSSSILKLFFSKWRIFSRLYLHSNQIIFCSPGDYKHFCIIFKRIHKSKVLDFLGNRRFLLTPPTFLVCSYHILYCFTQLEPTIYMLNFHNNVWKNMQATGITIFAACHANRIQNLQLLFPECFLPDGAQEVGRCRSKSLGGV